MNTKQRNVDTAEVSRFERLSARWWDPRGESRALHTLNPVRLAYVRAHQPLAGVRIADIGCGGGILSEALARAGAKVVGIDAAPGPLEAARAHLDASALVVDYRLCTAEELAEAEPAGFDAVTCMELLEHVPRPESVVAACARLLRPGSMAFFSTINRTLKAYLFAVLGAEYLMRLLPRGTHDYARFLRPSELCAMARAAGLKTVDVSGVRYDPLCERAHIHPDTSVNYLACFKFDAQ